MTTEQSDKVTIIPTEDNQTNGAPPAEDKPESTPTLDPTEQDAPENGQEPNTNGNKGPRRRRGNKRRPKIRARDGKDNSSADPEDPAGTKASNPDAPAKDKRGKSSPASGRPDVRILMGSSRHETYPKQLTHDDVVMVAELFGNEDDTTTYDQLVKDLDNDGSPLRGTAIQSCPSYLKVVERLCEYYGISNVGRSRLFVDRGHNSTRGHPLSHDPAAYAGRDSSENITVCASFGAEREIAFVRGNTTMSFPQLNNGAFSYGRDVNIRWKHGVSALPANDDTEGTRISIVIWGELKDVKDQDDSPALLEGSGPQRKKSTRKGRGRRENQRSPKKEEKEGDDPSPEVSKDEPPSAVTADKPESQQQY